MGDFFKDMQERVKEREIEKNPNDKAIIDKIGVGAYREQKEIKKIKAQIKAENQQILEENKLLNTKFNNIHSYNGLSNFLLDLEIIRDEEGYGDTDYGNEYAFDPKFTNQAVKYLKKEDFLYKVLKDYKYKKDLLNQIDDNYIVEFEFDYEQIRYIERDFIKTKNKAILENKIKELNKVYYKQYNPIDKFSTISEYSLYSLSFILISLSVVILIKLLINKLIDFTRNKLNNRNTNNIDKTLKINIKSNQIKKFVYSFSIAFLLCNFLQLTKLNNYKKQYFKCQFYSESPSEYSESVYFIKNSDYYLKDDTPRISINFHSYTYFGNHLDLPEDFYRFSRTWKGIYMFDYFDFRISTLKFLLANTFKDYFYCLIIGTLIFLSQYYYNKYLKHIKINIS